MNRTFIVPEADADSGDDRSREGSLERVEPRRLVISVSSSTSDPESDVDDVQITSCSQDRQNTEHVGDQALEHGLAEKKQEAEAVTPRSRYSSILTDNEVFNLAENDYNGLREDNLKDDKTGTSQTNPINLDETSQLGQHNFVGDSEEEAPEILPVKAVVQISSAKSTPEQSSPPQNPHGVKVVTSSKICQDITAGPIIADSDHVETESDVNFSSDDDTEMVKETSAHSSMNGRNRWQWKSSNWTPECSDGEDEDKIDKGMREADGVPSVVSDLVKSVKFPLQSEFTKDASTRYPRVTEIMVEDSQLPDTMLPKTSFSGPMDVNNETLNSWLRSAPRAPSPSDAALKSIGRTFFTDNFGEQSSKGSKIYPPFLPDCVGYTQGVRYEFGSSNNSAGAPAYNSAQDSFFDNVDRVYPRYDDGPFAIPSKYDAQLAYTEPRQDYNLSNRLSHHIESVDSYDVTAHHCPAYCNPSGRSEQASLVLPHRDELVEDKGKAQQHQPVLGPSEHKLSKLPISDIVNDAPNQSDTSARSLKRKADEMTNNDAAESTMLGRSQAQSIPNLSQESALPDAQPRENLPVTCEQLSQGLMIQSTPKIIPHGISNSVKGPARKKARTSPRRSGRVGAFVSGVLVGGLSLAGAFAAFVATIPDSVKDEVRKEFQNRL